VVVGDERRESIDWICLIDHFSNNGTIYVRIEVELDPRAAASGIFLP
jgi:hypothetical protein